MIITNAKNKELDQAYKYVSPMKHLDGTEKAYKYHQYMYYNHLFHMKKYKFSFAAKIKCHKTVFV